MRILNALIRGLESGGARVDLLHAAKLQVGPCLACLGCMHKTPGVCVQRDDMDKVTALMQKAAWLVLASPVYVDSFSAQLKVILDRCVCGLEPYLIRGPDQRVRHPPAWQAPSNWLLVSTCGFPEPETFEPIKAAFRAAAANMGASSRGELLIPGSIALQMEPAALGPHLELVQEAGAQAARDGCINPALLARINRPPLGVDRYLKLAARYEDWCRKNKAQAH